MNAHDDRFESTLLALCLVWLVASIAFSGFLAWAIYRLVVALA